MIKIDLRKVKHMKMGYCKNCKKKFSGRPDQLYCSLKCKNAHNNSLIALNKRITKQIDKTLHQNRDILQKILSNEKTKTVSREYLIAKEFDFRYYTNIYETKKGSRYYFCYNFGYIIQKDAKITIVQNQL